MNPSFFQDALSALMNVFFLEVPNKLSDFTCYCGGREAIGTRVFGGVTADPYEFPWLVLVIKEGNAHCGGTIINNLYILTAGHCVINATPFDMSVLLGAYDLGQLTGIEKEYDVTKIILHEGFATYEDDHNRNDIALLKLRTEITYTAYISPVCLPLAGESFVGRTAYVIGWGRDEFGEAFSVAKKGKVTVMDFNECLQSKVGVHISQERNSALCAYHRGVDSCQGDSGGPLILRRADNTDVLIGIISWGIGCAVDGFPGVYTQVSNFVHWIARNTKDASYCLGENYY